jgi:hypothetical protein
MHICVSVWFCHQIKPPDGIASLACADFALMKRFVRNPDLALGKFHFYGALLRWNWCGFEDILTLRSFFCYQYTLLAENVCLVFTDFALSGTF